MNTYGIMLDRIYTDDELYDISSDVDELMEDLPELPGEVRMTMTYQPKGQELWFAVWMEDGKLQVTQFWAENGQHAYSQARDHVELNIPILGVFKPNTP